jgi:uncharacterized tellurite resistance protein B-like protein
MFDSLKQFFADVTGLASPHTFADDDYRLAAVALLIHVASADGVIDVAERRRISEVVETRFGLDGAAATELLAAAEASDREAVDFFHFTSLLKRSLDDEGRRKIVEMMWDVAYSDGTVHEFEDNIVSRVAELLGVSPRDRVTLKQKAAHADDASSAAADPWSQAAPEGSH